MPKFAVIVGAGLSGLCSAIILKEHGYTVKVLETRNHIGGNCYDKLVDGIWVHEYGPHIFHTNNELVWEFLNRFTTFVKYEHKVLARTSLHPNALLSIPFNKITETQLGRSVDDDYIRKLFFTEYSEKMWGCSWAELPKNITTRVPKRRDSEDMRYFTDKYQGMPVNGYSGLAHRMAETIGTTCFELECDTQAWKEYMDVDLLVFTGSIDMFYGGQLGWLPYRTLRIEHGFLPKKESLPAATVNECNKIPYTRTTDYSVFPNPPYGAKSRLMVPITREYPGEWEPGKERFYPKRFDGAADALYDEYVAMYLSRNHNRNVLFLGRLGTYAYLDMHQAVSSAIHKTREWIRKD